jgi:hypothetical protein
MMAKRFVLVSFSVLILCAPFTAAQPGSSNGVIVSLLPKNSHNPTGQYTAGPMGMGTGAARLHYDHPCIKSDKYPARITIGVTYYGGEMAQMLKMQGDAANQQTIQSAVRELQKPNRPAKKEKLGGGDIVYVDYTSECPAEGAAGKGTSDRPPIPNVKLKGVTRTDNARLEIEVEGQITLDLARAAVTEVFENLKKADFSKAK